MPPRNAYFLYMVDFKKDQEAKLGRNLSMAEVSEMAAASWNEMDDVKRDLYRARAKGGNSLGKRNAFEKRTTQGVPFSEIDRMRNAKVNEEKQMIDRIHNLLSHFTVPVGICSYPIFIMSGNYFYRRQDKFVPAELALVKFNFLDGILERYHAYLDPGSVEMGYAADAKNFSDDTHKLPIPPNAIGETDFNAVFRKIWRLLEVESKRFRFDSGKPFVFTYSSDFTNEEENILMLKSFMTQFSKKESPIDVYPLSRLFFILTTNLFGIDRFQKIENISIVHMLLCRDSYEHCSGFSCEHHEKVDACAHCALSKATRLAYLMAKHLCEPLGINLVSGKHLPMNSELKLLHRSMQSVYESDAEEFNCGYETEQSECSFDEAASTSTISCLSDESRQVRLQKLLGMRTNDANCDYETNSEHSIDEELVSQTARTVADTSSVISSSKNTRRQWLHKLFMKCESDGTSTVNDALSSIGSVSVFDEEATIKSSGISQNNRRQLMQRLMEKSDHVSSIDFSQISINE